MFKEKHQKYIILFIFVIAFIIRSYVYWIMMNRGNYNGLVLNGVDGYIDEARNIVNGGEWFMGTLNGNYQLLTNHQKGFSTLLALFMKISSNHYYDMMHILMILCDSFVCVLLYWILKGFHRTKSGIFASAFWAINPLAIINVSSDLPDAFSCFFVALIVYLYYREYKNDIIRSVVLGISLAIAFYFRSEFMLFALVILVADMIRTKKVILTLRNWIVLFACFILVMSPWLIYSYQKSGHVIVSSTSAWGSTYEAIGEKEDNAWGIKIGDQYVDEVAIANGFDSGWTYDSESFFKEEVKRYILENPLEYLDIVINYRLKKAFLPGAYTQFNLNRQDTDFSITQYCSAYGPICTRAFVTLYSYEGSNAMILSGFLLIMMILFVIQTFREKKFGERCFMFALWLYFPCAISLLKQIEPRNVIASMVITTIAASYMIGKFAEFISLKIKRIGYLNSRVD